MTNKIRPTNESQTTKTEISKQGEGKPSQVILTPVTDVSSGLATLFLKESLRNGKGIEIPSLNITSKDMPRPRNGVN